MKVLQIGTGRWGANHLRVFANLPVDLYVAEVSESGRQKCLSQGIERDHITGEYEEFMDLVHNADLILSKGMANFETVFPRTLPSPVFFLFKVKCRPMQDYLGAPAGSFWAMWHRGLG